MRKNIISTHHTPIFYALGKNMSDQSKEIYRSAKTNNEIIKSVTQEKP